MPGRNGGIGTLAESAGGWRFVGPAGPFRGSAPPADERADFGAERGAQNRVASEGYAAHGIKSESPAA